MPTWRHLRAADYLVQPWRNGRGETREIARGQGDPFAWRLSWASIPEPGPFSPYPGYDRILVLLSGGPVKLSHGGEGEVLLHPLDSCCFRGEWRTSAELATPAEDLNLFVGRGRVVATIDVHSLRAGEQRELTLSGHEQFLFGVRGDLEVRDASSGQSAVLAARETVRIAGAATPPLAATLLRARARNDADLVWITLEPDPLHHLGV